MRKSDLYGIIGSAIFCGLVLLLLFLIVIPSKQILEEDGVVVSFGYSDEGLGQISKSTNELPEREQEQQNATTPVAPRASTQKQEQQELMTQEEESLKIAQEQERKKKREERIEQEKKKKEEERKIAEQKRLEEEKRLAEERRIAEEKRKRQEAIEKANDLGNVFGASDSATGSGTTSENTQQGNPVGKGTSEGNSWSLEGRRLIGRLVTPRYDKNIEGIIAVTIRVDESGQVVHAAISRATISDSEIRKKTVEAAKRTRFSAGKSVSSGTITYNFKLK